MVGGLDEESVVFKTFQPKAGMKEVLGPLNAGQGGREASPGRQCDG